MPAEAHAPAESPDDRAPRRRRWPWVVGGVVVLLTVLAAMLPRFVSTGPGTAVAVRIANGFLDGRAAVADLSASWGGPVVVRGLKLYDPNGREVVSLDRAEVSMGVWGAVFAPASFGDALLEKADVKLYQTADGSVSLIRVFPPREAPREPGPQPRGRLAFHQVRVEFIPLAGEPTTIRRAEGEIRLETLQDVGLRASLLPEAGGRITITGDLAKLSAERPAGRVEVRTDEPIPSAVLGPLLGPGLEGTVDLSVVATLPGAETSTQPPQEPRSDELLVEFNLTGARLGAPQTREATVRPLDLNATGWAAIDLRSFSGMPPDGEPPPGVRGQVEVSGEGVELSVEGESPLSNMDLPSREMLLAGLLEGEALGLPDFSLDARGRVDLKRLGQALPRVLELHPDLTLTGGMAVVETLRLRGGGQPQIALALEITEIAGRRRSPPAREASGGRTTAPGAPPPGEVRLPPISLDVRAAIERDIGLRVDSARLDAGFASLSAVGGPEDMDLRFAADLSRMRAELGELVDFGAVKFAGAIEGSGTLTRPPAEDATLTFHATGKQLEFLRGAERYQAGEASVEGRAAMVEPADAERSAVRIEADGEVQNLTAIRQDRELTVRSTNLHIEGRWTADRLAAWFGLRAGPGRVHTGGPETAPLRAGRLSVTGQVVSDPDGLATDGEARVENLQPAVGRAIDAVDASWKQVRLTPRAAKAAEIRMDAGPAGALRVQDLDLERVGDLALGGNFDVQADLGTTMGLAAPLAGWERTPGVSGRLNWAGRATTRNRQLTATGEATVTDLAVGSGGDVVQLGSASLRHEAAADLTTETLTLRRLDVNSEPLALQLAGTVSQFRSRRGLDLNGHYRAKWEPLIALLREVNPQVVEEAGLSLTGTGEGDLRVTGPLDQPSAEPVFRGVRTEPLPIVWEGGRAFGLVLGAPEDLHPLLVDGQLRLTNARIPASGGAVNLAATADFAGPSPRLRITERLALLDGVRIDPEVGRRLLSRINPIFAHVSQLDGTAFLDVWDIDLPLDESIRTSGRGFGRLDIESLGIQPTGLTARLLQLAGVAATGRREVVFSGMDFRIADGRIHYDNFAMTFGDRVELVFRGSVGFDETIEMWVALPIGVEMLRRFGASGRVEEYARILGLENARVEIPLRGDRLMPQLGSIDVQPLIRRATRALLRERLREGLESSADQPDEPGETTPEAEEPAEPAPKTTQPSRRPTTRPAEVGRRVIDILRDVLREDSDAADRQQP